MKKQATTLDEFIGSKIRKLRISKGEKPERVAAILSMPLEKYSAFELGNLRVPTGTVVDAAIFFQVTLSSIFDGFEVHHVRNSTQENLR